MQREHVALLGFLTLAIAIIFTGAYFSISRIRKNRVERENLRVHLINGLQTAFIKEHLNTYSDLNDLINGFSQISKLRLSLPWDLIQIVQELKYKLSQDGSHELQNLNKLIGEVNAKLDEEKIKTPFENVPTIERNLLIDILELSGKKENSIFRDKLTRLSEQIVTRQNTMDQLASDNSRSLKLSRQSFVWGIIFFIISLALTLYGLFK